MKKQLKGALPCFLAALIWGMSFVFQSTGVEKIDIFTFTTLRSLIGVLVLIPMSVFSIRFAQKKNPQPPQVQKKARKDLFKASLLCGICLFFGHNLQQSAFAYTEAGKVGFLTALYMILVPLIGLVFLRRNVSKAVWFSVLLACCGIFLISFKPGAFGGFGKGELYALGCSLFFAIQIVISDEYANRVDCIAMCCVQFAVCGVLSAVCMFLLEQPNMTAILSAKWELLYVGVLSTAGAFTLQLVGQKNTDPVLASMLLCLESVFSVLFAWIILGQHLSAQEITGCAVMFIAILLTLIPKETLQTLLHKKRLKG
ncbi:MAG: DMT family transporter [Oscillospiraceae bacterium]|nr:DMT family transporter [Oscillospiraceae bacterium]